MRLICFILTVAFVAPTVLAAQEALPSSPPRLIISERAIREGLVASAHTTAVESAAARQDDSLKNGAIVGAVVGAAAMGIFGGLLCNALQEPSDPPCWRSVLPIAGLGAGIGLGVGVGIDALATRTPQWGKPGPPPPFAR